ncbi:40S ribosomal protein S8 [Capsaspora owczarzaki ATCC 30864]|uniref:40S ribosomal protein S8 n=1 Tax=Capsaspora owczarzaki (strain ATCC 30864) TaxID=595528 RepID=UPI0001FE3858|nr:40S ribosomal protein S8 [Capsaspora owczarzaki ATCC 30864]|eukprot:XP_004343838.1 40S ribosomal protein S8 [Capsaspora owczarzaki ATCC 30864]
MGITRDNWHKRRATGGKVVAMRKKRKFMLGRPAANTKIGAKRINVVRTRGGNQKFRALRLDAGNFAWGSESVARKTRIINVAYNASNNELVRTNTLVKSSIIQIDATPFRQWFEAHYGVALGRKKGAAKSKKEGEAEEEDVLSKKRSHHAQRKIDARKPLAKIDAALEEQFSTGRLYAAISSRPGQSGRCDGYILEGKELEFYVKKIKAKKTSK